MWPWLPFSLIIVIVWLLFAMVSSPVAEATLSGANESWLTFWPFIVIMLAGEKEKMPVEFCGDAVNIVCCEPPAVDRTESNKSLVTDCFVSG